MRVGAAIKRQLGLKVTMEIPPLEQRVIYDEEHRKHVAFATTSVVYLSSDKGQLEIRVCDTCGYEDVACLHVKNKIDGIKLKLICRLCGM